MSTVTTVTTTNPDDYDRSPSSSSGCYKATNTYFTLVKREDDGIKNGGIERLEHKHRASLVDNPYYKQTVELTTLKKKKTLLEHQIKALIIMSNEKTMEDELYEPESTLLRQKYKEYRKLQKEYDKKAKKLRDSLFER